MRVRGLGPCQFLEAPSPLSAGHWGSEPVGKVYPPWAPASPHCGVCVRGTLPGPLCGVCVCVLASLINQCVDAVLSVNLFWTS